MSVAAITVRPITYCVDAATLAAHKSIALCSPRGREMLRTLAVHVRTVGETERERYAAIANRLAINLIDREAVTLSPDPEWQRTYNDEIFNAWVTLAFDDAVTP